MNIRPYTNALCQKKAFWVFDFDSRAGGVRVVQIRYVVSGERNLHIQPWDDGNHRVSMEYRGRQATLPTSFTDVEDMLKAIQFERMRDPAPSFERSRDRYSTRDAAAKSGSSNSGEAESETQRGPA